MGNREEPAQRAGKKGHVISFQAARTVGDSEESADCDMQILCVLHGQGELVSFASTEGLEAGDILCLRPGIRTRFQGCQALQTVTCRFSPRMFRRRLSDAFDTRALHILLDARPIRRFIVSIDRFRPIASLLAPATVAGDMGNIGRMLLLLETIVEHGKERAPALHRAILHGTQIFDHDIAREWALPEFAHELGLDPSYVARLFKSNVGLPPLAYLSLLRAEEATQLLCHEDLSCAAVGVHVGWNDPNYFSRRFRQHFGESPTSFKERLTHTKAET